MEKISVLAITKNGINTGKKLAEMFPSWNIFAPDKFSDDTHTITWYTQPTSEKIVELFLNNDALVCLFSLGAVIRLTAPHLKDKKTDPAVIVIDDQNNFVISALSGHIGGANQLTRLIAEKLGAIPVITTAADVNNTILVDMLGKEFGWKIEDSSTVTSTSAHMVNEEPIGVFQQAGKKNWYKNLPKNVSIYDSVDELKKSNSKVYLVISDELFDDTINKKSVIYRPPSLVVGIGLHRDTTKETIMNGIKSVFQEFNLSLKSIAKLTSIKKPENVLGLIELGEELETPVEYVEPENLAQISTPNPSKTVKAFEGTASVSEAAAIKISGGKLVVEKQKFPPNLTIAVARIIN